MPSFKDFAAAVLLLCATCVPLSGAQAANITRQDWGTTQNGEKASLYTLKGAGGLTASISDFGGDVVTLLVPDRQGKAGDITPGYDTLAEYEKGQPFGSLIGPFANRLAATFLVNGQIYTQTGAGERGTVHSGAFGFQKRMWSAVPHDGAEPSLTITIKNADGYGGFPGNVTVTVTYTVTRDNVLRIDFRGTSDKPAVLNLTNHSYFNLGGQASGSVEGETLTLFADRYIANPPGGTATVTPVAGTNFDFTTPRRLGDAVARPEAVRGINVPMIVAGAPSVLRPAAHLQEPLSGRVMDVFTTQPAFQFYVGKVMPGSLVGKGGTVYGDYYSVSFETMYYPDSPNHPEFPSTLVTPEKPLHEVTEYRFSTLAR